MYYIHRAYLATRPYHTKQIITLHNIIKQWIVFQTPLSLNSIDFKKTFDSIHQESIWEVQVHTESHSNMSTYIETTISIQATV